MARRICAVNTGASTLKLAMLEVAGDEVGELQRIERSWTPGQDEAEAVRAALGELTARPDAFGHRIVHGGTELTEPVMITAEIERKLEALVPLAPLHNGPALAAIRAVKTLHEGLPSVAVFDTAFHARRPKVSVRYALPSNLVDEFGVRRYGFHGLAHASLVSALAECRGERIQDINAVTLQLGAGCSACAVRNGRSIETSMGYTPLEGLVMTTRSGDVDPAIVLRLMRAGFDADRIEAILTRRSGLYALSGLSDMREILAAEVAGNEDARFAIELFCYRIVLTVGAYFTLLGGDAALVFGGGIGAHSPSIRERIARGLGVWSIELDAARNARNAQGLISAESSRVVYALETNEEAVIARTVNDHLEASVTTLRDDGPRRR
jgi:acetate kinase